MAIEVKSATVNQSHRGSIVARLAGLAALLAASVPARAAVSHGFTQLLDSVVRIDVNEVSYDEGAKRFEASIGSGVVLSADGLVLTNAHLASPRAVEIHVTLPSLEQVD